MVQITKRVALYCRVSTADQDGSRQEHDLRRYAKRAKWKIVDLFIEYLKDNGMSDRIPK